MSYAIALPELTPAPLTPGTLYLVATPIGNMEDITLRAIRTLRDCDLVAAEDTRHTGMLLKRLGLAKRQISTHKFNEAKRSAEIITLLEQGGTVSLVSDAGSPGISDPGQRVVDAVLIAGFRVEAVPGACALIAALTPSGLSTDEFHFCGFLPVKSGQRPSAWPSCWICRAPWPYTNHPIASPNCSMNWLNWPRPARWSWPAN